MKVSQEGLSLIKKFEGLRLTAYKDSVGVWTIGYGHTRHVVRGQEISVQQAESFLLEDVGFVEKYLNKQSFNLTQNQFDAISSWIFNLGSNRFGSSTLKKRIANGSSATLVADQIIKWIYAGGVPLLGLIKRRIAEANMFLGKEVYYYDINKKKILCKNL